MVLPINLGKKLLLFSYTVFRLSFRKWFLRLSKKRQSFNGRAFKVDSSKSDLD